MTSTETACRSSTWRTRTSRAARCTFTCGRQTSAGSDVLPPHAGGFGVVRRRRLGSLSECGDIDGDGIDECIWTTPAQINVYKAVGKDSLQKVWHWYSDHGSMQSLVSTVYDVNNDGYKELITAGNEKISIFEVDAVDLVSPNHGTYKVGDTVPIRWATHSPPRCDSLSLFLRRDSLVAPRHDSHGASGHRYSVSLGRALGRARHRPHRGDGLWSRAISTTCPTASSTSPAAAWPKEPAACRCNGRFQSARTRPAARSPCATTCRVRATCQSAYTTLMAGWSGHLRRRRCFAGPIRGRDFPSGVLPAGVYFLHLDRTGTGIDQRSL